MRKEKVSIIIFGGTSDLTQRKLIPAISDLFSKDLLDKDSLILGIARQELNDESYKKLLVDSSLDDNEKKILEKANIKYLRNTNNHGACPKELRDYLEKNESSLLTQRIYYMAIGPNLLFPTLNELKNQRITNSTDKNVKIVLEKPIGLDLESSYKIEKELETSFERNNIFRLDHYLGKKGVNDILKLRFEDPDFEKILHSDFVNSIEVILDEDLHLGKRIISYNDLGVVKDVMQNHMLQTLSLVLMDLSDGLTSNSLKNNKLKVLENLDFLPFENNIFAQYESYKKEAADHNLSKTQTETFAKIFLSCNLPRWKKVKLILRSGKKLSEKCLKIVVNLKPEEGHKISSNKIEISIFPKLDSKFDLDKIKQKETYSDGHSLLISNVLEGNQKLFVSREESEAAWKIVEKVDKLKKKSNLLIYKDYTDPEELLKKSFK